MKFVKRLIITVLVLILMIIVGVIASGYGKYRQAVSQLPVEDAAKKIRASNNFTPIEEISPVFVDAMISVEDKRFYEHSGVDVLGVVRAFKVNFKNKSFTQGGSSITQQLAKNMYFMNDNSFTRKIAESIVAVELEATFTKEEILELYFNTIYYGSGYYRIYDASTGYFGKIPSELSDYEATLLAGIPNAPSVYSLDNNPDLAMQRQKKVVDAMVECDKLTEEEAEEILGQK